MNVGTIKKNLAGFTVRRLVRVAVAPLFVALIGVAGTGAAHASTPAYRPSSPPRACQAPCRNPGPIVWTEKVDSDHLVVAGQGFTPYGRVDTEVHWSGGGSLRNSINASSSGTFRFTLDVGCHSYPGTYYSSGYDESTGVTSDETATNVTC